MFFPEDEPEVNRSNPQKQIYVYENGTPDSKPKIFKISKKTECFKEIMKELNYSHLRLFNAEGAEYFQDDLIFAKNKAILYASNGEQYNSAGCFGEYEITKKLGEGGFGEVLLGIHRQTGEKVAIKIIKTDKIGSVTDIDNIFVEAETLKGLKHQNIVKVHNCLTLKNMKVAIIMEYLEGGQLLQIVKKQQRLSEELSKVFIRQIAKAMSYCHNNGLIHRDLKLENMLLVNSQQHRIKIIDFGIAGIIKSLTWENLDIGSLTYMAPECFVNNKDYKIDGRIDVWATGIILYGMLVGQLPFGGTNSFDTIQAIKQGQYNIPKKIAKQLSPQCLDMLRCMLQVNPTQRLRMAQILDHPWMNGNLFKIEEKTNTQKQKLPQIKEQKQKASIKDSKPVLKKNVVVNKKKYK